MYSWKRLGEDDFGHDFPLPPTVRSFTGPQLLQIAMPLGGIGAGSICLNGHGGLSDFSRAMASYAVLGSRRPRW